MEAELTLLVRRAQRVNLRTGALDRPIDRAAYGILGRLYDAGPQRPSALADHFRLDASTISRQASALEHRGLIERVPDAHDGRAALLRLTGHGEEALMNTRAVRRQVVHDVLNAWPPDQLETFAALLAAFNTGLDQQLHTDHRPDAGDAQ